MPTIHSSSQGVQDTAELRTDRARDNRLIEPKASFVTVDAGLTTILPLYNEAATLPSTLDTISSYANGHPRHHFIFVSDGSSDATVELLRERVAAHDGSHTPGSAPANMSFVAFAENRGKGRVICEAMQLAQTECVCFMDGDMAYGLDHLDEIAAALRTHDVVIGSRKESPDERRNTRKLRRLSGWCFNKLVRVGLNLPFADTQAGIKGFRLSAARTIFPRVTLQGFAFDVEMLYIARLHGLTIAEIPARVSRAHRKKPSNVNMFKEPLRMAGNLLQIRFNDMRGKYD